MDFFDIPGKIAQIIEDNEINTVRIFGHSQSCAAALHLGHQLLDIRDGGDGIYLSDLDSVQCALVEPTGLLKYQVAYEKLKPRDGMMLRVPIMDVTTELRKMAMMGQDGNRNIEYNQYFCDQEGKFPCKGIQHLEIGHRAATFYGRVIESMEDTENSRATFTAEPYTSEELLKNLEKGSSKSSGFTTKYASSRVIRRRHDPHDPQSPQGQGR